LNRDRWFFAKITGRRRIGKTRLIQQALQETKDRSVFYVQIPDSAPSGVIAAVRDAAETFQLDGKYELPTDLLGLAKFASSLIKDNYIVVLDEFQYFNRPKLKDFCSYLQHEVDTLTAKSSTITGGIFVLGSIHTEMMAILEDRSAPLYNRITDEVSVTHWEISSLLELFREFKVNDPHQILFFWNLFEGVPKFYRDCLEQNVLGLHRTAVIKKMFFESSSPLRTEADSWFMKQLHGRYDTILKYITRNSGCTHSDLITHVRSISQEREEQVGGHLQVLQDKYMIIEKKIPILAPMKARKGRYYIADKFLRSWLGALSAPVSAINFSPIDLLVGQANQKMQNLEGHGLEKMAALVYEERSRKGLPGFALTNKIEGYWDRSDIEIDLVAVNETEQKIRFGSCKRSEEKLLASIPSLKKCAEKFLKKFAKYHKWTIEYVVITPQISQENRTKITSQNVLVEDFSDLFSGL
jgi:AAA+ ATPase superfamily predicted ATPase